VAENLGEAQLRLTVDLSAFEASLQKAKSLIDKELGSATARPTTRSNSSSRSSSGSSGPSPELARFIQKAKDLNINTSWGKAVQTLNEIDGDLALIGAGQDFNLKQGWTAALSDLQQINADLQLISSGNKLNIRTSWSKFLSEIETVKADLALATSESALNKELARGREIGRLNTSPISGRLPGGGVIPGSPADRESRARAKAQESEAAIAELARARRQEAAQLDQQRNKRNTAVGNAVSSSLIGGAFPALFGQGAGASVGGALGGALGIFGGGFGFAGSLIGTAIGQQADNLGKLSQALQDPIGRFQELQQAAVLSSRSLEKNIEALISAGRFAEAEAKIREDLAKRGLDAATANQLAAESDKMQRSLAELGLSIGLVVQGPLTDLINNFNRLLEPGRVAAQSRAIQAGLSPEDRTAFQNRRRELNMQGFGILEANKQANEEFAPKTADAVIAQEKLTAAQLKDNAVLSARKRLIDATSQGQERLTLERQKELLIEEKKAQLRATPNDGLRIEQDTALRIYEIDQQIRQIEGQRFAESIAAANQLKSIQEEIAIQQQRGSLTGTGIGALQSVKALEDAKRAEQDAQAALRANPGSTDLFNASQAAAANVELAAAKTKADLQEAFKTAQDAVRSISRGIEDAVTGLNAARGSAEGINRFIGPQSAFDRQEAANANLFREASQLANQLDVTATFTGGLTERNSQLTEFINAARQELRGTEDIRINTENLAKANNDLAVVNDALVNINTQLAEATANLASKDWNVYVNAAATADLPRGVEVFQ